MSRERERSRFRMYLCMYGFEEIKILKPEEAKSDENAGFSYANGEGRGQGAEHHQQQGESVDSQPPLEVAEPSEHELADGGAQKRGGYEGGGDHRWGLKAVVAFAVVVIYSPHHLDDESD